MTLSMQWSCKPFDELTVHELHDALALRCRVFILEQGPYQDADEYDKRAWHLLGRDPGSPHGQALLATLRFFGPAVKYEEASIGRVACAPEIRGHGIGRQLVAEGMRQVTRLFPGQPVRISAQAHLQRMYAEHGFRTVSEEYLEDDIPHVEMLFTPTAG
ncbi:GNAT family N-acetyltransferase [Diaphorobacter ruginosibacter]|uniref:GNAT family N-acetyltransferase n=1 Tax=Diaphorobacter ruginosibacter TaxID=1715720 RepID=A0A7G9RIU3_9BURK|nr:GNAT family N-acetyltransferase [Diaphorobacter ruginosibacter]QNN55518.1 GNAT family N-acetyltransferase [Diaphorobacter ruginosibacter]